MENIVPIVHEGVPSKDLADVLSERLVQLEEELGALAQRARDLAGATRKLEEERGHIGALLALHDPGRTAPPPTGPLDPVDMVVALLKEKGPLHYRDIEKELRSRAWYQAGGADPANTLLAKYFQDSRLYRPKRGVYALRPPGQTAASVGTKRSRAKQSRKELGR
jgi:hypothetical protein